MPKDLPPKPSWFEWVYEFEDLEWPDVIFVVSGMLWGIGFIMFWMAFDKPEEWEPVISALIGLGWLVAGVGACRLALQYKRNKG